VHRVREEELTLGEKEVSPARGVEGEESSATAALRRFESGARRHIGSRFMLAAAHWRTVLKAEQ
jgi:hypothetical protein